MTRQRQYDRDRLKGRPNPPVRLGRALIDGDRKTPLARNPKSARGRRSRRRTPREASTIQGGAGTTRRASCSWAAARASAVGPTGGTEVRSVPP